MIECSETTLVQAAAVYGAIDMDWAKLVGQIAKSYGH